MEFTSFVTWAFPALLTGAIITGVRILWKLEKSVEKLNEKLGKLMGEHQMNTKDIERHEREIQSLKEHRA